LQDCFVPTNDEIKKRWYPYPHILPVRTGEGRSPNEVCAPCAKTVDGCRPQAALPLTCGYENYVP
jgi:hypothetical protein